MFERLPRHVSWFIFALIRTKGVIVMFYTEANNFVDAITYIDRFEVPLIFH